MTRYEPNAKRTTPDAEEDAAAHPVRQELEGQDR